MRHYLFGDLTRYIMRQLIWSCVLVIILITSIIWLSQSLRFIDWMVNRGLPIEVFLYLGFLVSSNFVPIILPIAVFLAVIIVYLRLIKDSELVAMFAAGLSPNLLMLPAYILVVMVSLFSYFMAFYGLPVAYHTYKELQSKMSRVYTGVLLQEGVFTQMGEGVTIFIRDRDADNPSLLHNVLISDERNPNQSVIVTAKNGVLVSADNGPKILLTKGHRQELDYKTGHMSFLDFDNYMLEIERLQSAFSTRTLLSTERFIGDLFNPTDVSDAGLLSLFRVEAHRRLASPLLIPAFAAVALASLLGAFGGARRGYGVRITVAVTVILSVQMIFFGFTGLAAGHPFFNIMLYFLPIITFTIAMGFVYHWGQLLRAHNVTLKWLAASPYWQFYSKKRA
ncbi:MAG: LptF/LptG family permease [Alphaproteobacteria bacterium]|nr:LptF/LptG family permease [Alphaproteobacteria bacterium]